MANPRTVNAAAFSGFSMTLAQIFGKGPKFQVQCGDCDGVFSGRIEMTDDPRLRCDWCGTVNVLAGIQVRR